MIHKYEEKYEDYLMDASKRQGYADYIAFPESKEDLEDILEECISSQMKITLQGCMTGISGGAVPSGGLVINFSKMNKILGMEFDGVHYYLRLQPGVSLETINDRLRTRQFDTETWDQDSIAVLEQFKKAPLQYFPPDPTETTASIGGMVACNASGACSYHYGPTRSYVEGLECITSTGNYTLTRHDNHIFTSSFDGQAKVRKAGLKNVAGYFYEDGVSWLDLMIGSEGTLGLISEIVIKLVAMPSYRTGIMLFFSKNTDVLEFVKWTRGDCTNPTVPVFDGKLVALEYFDKNALDIVTQFKDIKTELKQMPLIDDRAKAALYVEIHEDDESVMMQVVEDILSVASTFSILEGCEWFALDPGDLNKLKSFRHAVPECVNMIIDGIRIDQPHIRKVGTDMAVSNDQADLMMAFYQRDLAETDLDYVIFGHIGDNHLHINFMPKDMVAYERANQMVALWADKVCELEGTVSAEHGIGVMKKALLKKMYSSEEIDVLRDIKRYFDPDWILNSDVIF